MAKAFADELVLQGWQPTSFAARSDLLENNLSLLRAVAGHQPKASRTPPLVTEHKACVVVRTTDASLKPPCALMNRLQVPWALPQQTFSKIRIIPQYSQLLRYMPLRIKRGEKRTFDNMSSMDNVMGSSGVSGSAMNFFEESVQNVRKQITQNGLGQRDSESSRHESAPAKIAEKKSKIDEVLSGKETGVYEQTWGVPWTPHEFVKQAVKGGHPRLLQSFLPEELQEAIHCCAHMSDADLIHMRSKWVQRWAARANSPELKEKEKNLKTSMPKHLARLLEPKRLLLWKEMLEDLGYDDLDVVNEVVEGTDLLGEVPLTGIFPQQFKAATTTVAQLKSESAQRVQSVLRRTYSSGDFALDKKVYDETMQEVSRGWARGPFNIKSLPQPCLVGRRFGLVQANKTRLIDDLSVGGQNSSVQASGSPQPQGVDVVGAILYNLLNQCQGCDMHGRSYDLKSAYKQLGVSNSSMWANFVSVYNPYENKVEIFQFLAVPFGASRSVHSFLRIIKFIWYLGVKALKVPWSVFFDDFIVFSKPSTAECTDFAITSLFKLLGWAYAESGDKASAFGTRVSALGIQIELESFARGKVFFSNTEKRRLEFINLITDNLKQSQISQKQGQILRGKLQFANSQMYGRLGAMCLHEISRLTDSGNHAFDEPLKKAMARYIHFLKQAEPRALTQSTGECMFLFTDASYERGSDSWPCGIGGVLVDQNGQLLEFFSHGLKASEIAALGASVKKTIIFEAEMLAVLIALLRWSVKINHKAIVCFIDNNLHRPKKS